MAFWDGYRWVRETAPRVHRQSRTRRVVDWLLTGAILAGMVAIGLPFARTLAGAPTLTLAPVSGVPGTKIVATGQGFSAKGRVELTWDGATAGMPSVATNGHGSFRASFRVPTTTVGRHASGAQQAASTSSGSMLATAPFDVTGITTPTPAPTLIPTAGPTPTLDPAPSPTISPTLTPAPTAPPAPAVTPTLTPTPTTTLTTLTPTPTLTPTTANPVVLGAFIPGAPSDPSKIDAYASLTGAMPHIVMWYQEWSGKWNAFYAQGADAIRTRGAMPLISWEPWAGNKDDPQWSLNTIIDGSHDAYIHQWTHDVAAWGHPIYVRPMYEMNGPWSAWGYGVNGNTAAQYVAAWRHVVDIAHAEGATNIRWVWCPNEDNGDPRYTSYASLYPGDAYVDWAGIDGYNWGTSQSWSSWQDLYTVFKDSVDKIVAVTGKPLMIGEIGSTELGGDKAAWIANGFARLLTDLPQVRAVIWFDVNKETDWRVDSSAQSLNAFRAVATSGALATTLP